MLDAHCTAGVSDSKPSMQLHAGGGAHLSCYHGAQACLQRNIGSKSSCCATKVHGDAVRQCTTTTAHGDMRNTPFETGLQHT
jgi:hypothetical protein